MCYRVFGMMHIEDQCLLIGKFSPCGGSRIPLLLSKWSSTICLFFFSFYYCNVLFAKKITFCRHTYI